ncbi:MAG: hypothetical protein CVU05_10650 [Bacteroidetes bacterium HGW-Bacteroidetes-21]|nr:MAG: hypothetical protein CVU05_10650 [Bacteroidetes bacterium HGW-Bacteroidetes-21]
MKVFKKILKYFLIFIIVLIGLLIATPFIFKDKIIEKVKTEVNKQVDAKVDFGEFSLSIFSDFPNLSFDIKNVCVVGKGEFENDTLAFLPDLHTVLNLMSVFGDEIKIREIGLEKPIINLLVTKEGKANWDIAISDTTQTETVDTTTSSFKLSLKKLELTDANILYDDKSMAMTTDIKNLDFLLRGDLSDASTELDILAVIDSLTFGYEGMNYLEKSSVTFKAGIDADLANSVYKFKENKLTINQLDLAFDGSISMPTDDIGIDLKMSSPQTEFKNILSMVPAIFMSGFENIKTSGTFGFDGTINGTYGEKSMPGFDFNFKIDNGYFKYPDLPTDVKNINVAAHIANKDGNEDNTIIDISKFHVDMGANPVDMKLLVTTPVSDPNLEGWLKGRIDLNTVNTFYPMEGTKMSGTINSDITFNGKMSQIEQEKYEDFKAEGKITCSRINYESGTDKIRVDSAYMEVSPKYFDLKNLTAIMGESDFNMNGKIENFMAYAFRDELLKGNFNFKSNFINVNQFMGNETETASSTPAAEDTSSMSVIEIPKNIDFTLTTSIGRLLYDKLDITAMQGEVVISGGKLNMNNVKMNMLDGSLAMNGYYSTEKSDPAVKFDFNINDFDIKKSFDAFNTVQKLVPMAEKCNGKFGMSLSFESLLSQTMEPIMNTLNGIGVLNTKNIVVTNSVLEKVAEALKKDNFKSMKLDKAVVKFTIKDGNIEVEPFTTMVDRSEVTFGGSQSLDQILKYNLSYKIPSKDLGNAANDIFKNMSGAASQAGIEIKVPEFITINGNILGTLLKPELKLDMKQQATNAVDNIKEQVTDKINEEVDKAKAEAIKKAREQADKLNKEAETRAAQIVAAAEQTAKQVNSNAKIAADKVKSEGDVAAQKVMDAAKGKGPIADAAAKKSAEKIKKEAAQKATDLENTAANEAANGVNKAKQESDNIKKTAKAQGDKLIEDASKQ